MGPPRPAPPCAAGSTRGSPPSPPRSRPSRHPTAPRREPRRGRAPQSTPRRAPASEDPPEDLRPAPALVEVRDERDPDVPLAVLAQVGAGSDDDAVREQALRR